MVRECSEWIKQYNLPNIFSVKVKKSEWKRLVKKAVYKESEETLKTKMLSYDKLNKSELIGEHFGVQPYVKELNVHSGYNGTCSMVSQLCQTQRRQRPRE